MSIPAEPIPGQTIALPDLQAAIVPDPLVVSPDTSVRDAMLLMSHLGTSEVIPSSRLDAVHQEARSSCVLVVEGNQAKEKQLVGILTARDLVRLSTQEKNLDVLPIRQVMSVPGIMLQESDLPDLLLALNLLQQHGTEYLPVLDQNHHPIGMITPASLLQALQPQALGASVQVLPQQVGQLEAEKDELLHHNKTQGECQNTLQSAENALKIQRDFNQLIAEIASRFVDLDPKDLDLEIERTLQLIGEITQVDTSYLFVFDEVSATVRMTHEWSKSGYSRQLPLAQAIPQDACPWSNALLKQREVVYIPSVADAPPEAAIDQATWQQFNLKALLIVPLIQKSVVTGLMGFASFTQVMAWEEEMIRLLRVMAQTIANAQQQTQDEQCLSMSEERLRLALEAANQGLYDLNLQTGEAVVNSQYATMLGYDPSTFQETHAKWLERLHPDDRPVVVRTYEAYVAGTLPKYKVEFRQLTQTGEWKWILSLGKIVAWDNAGQPLRMLGTHTDISDRKQIEEQAQHRLDILEVARDLVASTDASGRVTYLNQAAYDLLKISPDEDIHQTQIPDYHSPEMANFILQQALPQTMQQGFWAGETRFRRRDGTEFPVWQTIVAHRQQDGSVTHFSTIARDITEIKQAAAERQQAEKARLELTLLENLLDTILAGYWDADLVSNQQYISPGFKRMFGYEDHELPNSPETWKQIIVPEDLPKALDGYAQHVQSRGKIPYYNELRYHHKNGSIVWVICTGRVIEWDTAGNPLRLIGCHIDITRQKQAEEQLRKSDTHLKTAQRIGKLGSWEFELKTELVSWSDEVFRIFERNLELGPPSFEELQQLFHPDDRPLHQQAVQTAIATASPYEIECRILRRSGTLGYIQARGEPIFDAMGRLVQLVGTILDITERKQAEQQLQLLSGRLALAVKSAAMGIWDWDVVHNVLTWDERMYELYGITSTQFTSVYDAWASRVHPDDRAQVETAIQNALKGEKDYDPQFRVNLPDGTTRFLKAYGLVQRNDQGEPQRMIGINYDMTDQKVAETKLQQTSAQLAASNRELEAFAYSVSHDLRAPLRTIDGFSKALLEDYGDLFNEEAQDYFDCIRAGVQRMGTLIDDLLRLSRVSRAEMQYTLVNLSALVQQIVTNLQKTEPERQVEFRIAEGVRVYADANLLRIVLENLFNNAWKFTSHHPTACIEFGMDQSQGQITYFVRDDGAGFDMAYASMLFGVFQRLHNTDEFPGTGIGLATVQRVIHRHGGAVWAEGAIEQGATVYFTLPNVTVSSGA